MNERCDNCRFWYVPQHMADQDGSPDDREGLCRRYPPVLVELLAKSDIRFAEENGGDEYDEIGEQLRCVALPHNAAFPATTGNEWCGEHRINS